MLILLLAAFFRDGVRLSLSEGPALVVPSDATGSSSPALEAEDLAPVTQPAEAQGQVDESGVAAPLRIVVKDLAGSPIKGASAWVPSEHHRCVHAVLATAVDEQGTIVLERQALVGLATITVGAFGFKSVDVSELERDGVVYLAPSPVAEVEVRDTLGHPIANAHVRLSQAGFFDHLAPGQSVDLEPRHAGRHARFAIHGAKTRADGLAFVATPEGSYAVDVRAVGFRVLEMSTLSGLKVPGDRMTVEMAPIWAAVMSTDAIFPDSLTFRMGPSQGIEQLWQKWLVAKDKKALEERFDGALVYVQSPTQAWLTANPDEKELVLPASAVFRDGFRRATQIVFRPLDAIEAPLGFDVTQGERESVEPAVRFRVFDAEGVELRDVLLQLEGQTSRNISARTGVIQTLVPGPYRVALRNTLVDALLQERECVVTTSNPSRPTEFNLCLDAPVGLLRLRTVAPWGDLNGGGKFFYFQGDRKYELVMSGAGRVHSVYLPLGPTKVRLEVGDFDPVEIELDCKRGSQEVRTELRFKD